MIKATELLNINRAIRSIKLGALSITVLIVSMLIFSTSQCEPLVLLICLIIVRFNAKFYAHVKQRYDFPVKRLVYA